LLKADREAAEWQAVMEALMLGGHPSRHMIITQINVVRAFNRNVEGRLQGRRRADGGQKLKRDL
jgi:hypothetical protein